MPSCRRVWLACLASAVLGLASVDASAQSFNGAITGVVRDSTGGVVADTALTLRNVATDQTVGTAVSGRGRRIRLPQPRAGALRLVTAIKDGFQTGRR